MTQKLTPRQLTNACTPDIFTFATTGEMGDAGGLIGQERALSSIEFGLSLTSKGFNIFALGESGTGKSRAIRSILAGKALAEPVPHDWCYVHNFKDPDTPLAISMEPGKAVLFRKDMAELIKALTTEIPKVFESKEYEKQRSGVIEAFQQLQRDLFTKLEQEATEQGFAIKRGPQGFFIVPLKKAGEPLTEDEFNALDEETRTKAEKLGRMLQEKLNDIGRSLKAKEKVLKEDLANLERQVALGAVGHVIDELQEKYVDYPKVATYLETAKEDILSHLDDFKPAEEPPGPMPFLKPPRPENPFARYTVNVIVNNGEQRGAPVVIESNPTYLNLFGKLEYKVQYGMAMTDLTMLKAGALHRANGGYLVINALDLLKNLFAYDSLKRAIKNREIRIEDVWEQYRLMSTTAIKPEAIPLNVKVILTGSPNLYYMLHNLDEEYRELFKVKADFDSRMPRTDETTMKYAAFVSACQHEEGLLPFDRSGVAKIVEYGSRLADHQMKLSARFSDIADLLREAHFWATKEKSAVVSAPHVLKALDEKLYRVNRIEEIIQEMMLEDTIIVETAGTRVGQVNGLAILDLGDHSFGKPSRITAKTYVGKAGIINIERETKMSGRIHEKAIMIIRSYLGSCYAMKKPISLSASITFEQLYEMVEGDSATCAEFYALLSSISGAPLKQCFAVTGSMDQNGDVQPIGGVNEKIEGFYHLCTARGLDGTHGVIIPRRNLKHLMLKQEVVDAVESGKFSLYAIDRVEEGLELLTGMTAGVLQDDGAYPEGTVHSLVMKRLEEISAALDAKRDKGEEKPERKDNNSNDQ